MFNPRHLLRMSKWARHPPAAWRVKLVIGVFIAALAIAGVERFIGWPDALSTEPRPRPHFQKVPQQPLSDEAPRPDTAPTVPEE